MYPFVSSHKPTIIMIMEENAVENSFINDDKDAEEDTSDEKAKDVQDEDESEDNDGVLVIGRRKRRRRQVLSSPDECSQGTCDTDFRLVKEKILTMTDCQLRILLVVIANRLL